MVECANHWQVLISYHVSPLNSPLVPAHFASVSCLVHPDLFLENLPPPQTDEEVSMRQSQEPDEGVVTSTWSAEVDSAPTGAKFHNVPTNNSMHGSSIEKEDNIPRFIYI